MEMVNVNGERIGGLKFCSHCGEDKAASEFHRHAAMKDGLQPWCKECVVQVSRERNALISEERRAARTLLVEWRREHGKACVHCGVCKPLVEFTNRSRTLDGHENVCVQCRRAAKASAQKTRYAHDADVRDRAKLQARQWASSHKDELRAWRVAHRKQLRDDLAEPYVRRLLSASIGIPGGEVPGALVKVKQQHLKLLRLIKERNDEERETAAQ